MPVACYNLSGISRRRWKTFTSLFHWTYIDVINKLIGIIWTAYSTFVSHSCQTCHVCSSGLQTSLINALLWIHEMWWIYLIQQTWKMKVLNSLFFTQFVSDKDVQKFRGGTSSDV